MAVAVEFGAPVSSRRRAVRVGFAAWALTMLLVPSAAAQGFKWWQSDQVRQALQLTPQQVHDIEHIYGASLPQRKRLRAELDHLEQQLAELLRAADAEERDAALLIDRVEAARARRNTARTMMLFRIRRVLTSRQRSLLAQNAARQY